VKKSEKISFGLLELEMADLERFWRKTPLGPLGVNFKYKLWQMKTFKENSELASE
jgi:hypothetical protein